MDSNWICDLFASGIHPSKEILDNLLDDSAKIKSILKDLEEWSILIFRKHLNSW